MIFFVDVDIFQLFCQNNYLANNSIDFLFPFSFQKNFCSFIYNFIIQATEAKICMALYHIKLLDDSHSASIRSPLVDLHQLPQITVNPDSLFSNKKMDEQRVIVPELEEGEIPDVQELDGAELKKIIAAAVKQEMASQIDEIVGHFKRSLMLALK